MISEWTKWKQFPDPRKLEYFSAPFGAGAYEIKNRRTKELLKAGEGGNVAERMCSLLPRPHGASGRNNTPLIEYILENLQDISFRTIACSTKEEAEIIQNDLRRKNDYKFEGKLSSH